MNEAKFQALVDKWREAEQAYAEALIVELDAKEDLLSAESMAWTNGEVGGRNSDERKASLFIIAHPQYQALKEAKALVYERRVEAKCLDALVSYNVHHAPGYDNSLAELIDSADKK